MHLHRVLIAATVASLLAAPASAQPNCNLPSARRAPVVLVSSGGISKGAYQAGALWAFLQLERSIREQHPLQAVTIPVITGASAGNVNTLLNALEWATPLDRSRRETSSLLWQLWTSVGLDGLLPKERFPDDDVVSVLRAEAFDPILPVIERARREASLLPCASLLGITMTRADTSASYKVRDIRDARVLRHVSLARFRTTGRGFGIHAVDSLGIRKGLGVVVSAPLADTRDSSLNFDRYIDHIRASAAFPVAFPPRQLQFTYIEALKAGVDSGEFLDGGVFDNEPMTLGLDLLVGPGDATSRRCSPSRTDGFERCRIAFVSPNRLRTPTAPSPSGSRDSDRAPATSRTSARPYSLSKYVGFAGKIIGAAADNELVSLERRLLQEDGLKCRAQAGDTSTVCFVASSRLFPIYGATAASFGAFIGRPLRELDFYIGAYDGLRRSLEARCETRPDVEACTNAYLTRLLASPDSLPELSSTGRHLIDFMRREELGGGRISDTPAGIRASISDDRERDMRLLFWALRTAQLAVDTASNGATREVRERAHRRLCSFESVILEFFCRDGLVLALNMYSEEKPAYRDETIRKDAKADPVSTAFFSDRAFIEIADDPDKQLYRRGRQVLFRLRQLERRDNGFARFLVGVTELAAGKGYENVKTREPHMLTSVPAEAYMGGGHGWFADAWKRRITPMAFSVQSSGRPTFTWTPVEGYYFYSNAIAPTLSAGFNGDLAVGARFQTDKTSRAKLGFVGGAALHVQQEWCAFQACSWSRAGDVQVMVAGRSLGIGWRHVRERGPAVRTRNGIILSINDVPALTHLIWH